MHIKLLPSQIPLVWEHIKFGIAQIGEVPNEEMSRFSVNLLCQLLSEKAQCWVTFNEERIILNISVTRIDQLIWTGEKELYLEGFYAFSGTTPTSLNDIVRSWQDFAKSAGCVRVTASSRVPRACTLLEEHGFKLRRRSYALALEP